MTTLFCCFLADRPLTCIARPPQYRTQDPVAFYIKLSNEFDPQAFVSEMKSIAAFLTSISDQTMRAGGSRDVFLDIRAIKLDTDDEFDSAREDDLDEESSPFKYRATFQLHFDDASRFPGWCLLLSVDARRDSRGVPAHSHRTRFNRSYHLVDAPR